MKLKAKIAVTLAAIVTAGAANATVLGFDNLAGTYGDGYALGANMVFTANGMSYTEGGYVLSLNTPTVPSWFAHIGDAGGSGTFNWHDDGDNGTDTTVTLTAANGGLFNLLRFDYASSGAGMAVSVNGNVNFIAAGSGTLPVNFYNVSSITFSSTGYTYNVLDNVEVTPGDVPEPGSFALIGLGLLGAGLARRKGAKK